MGEMRLPYIDSDLLFRGALIKTDLTVQQYHRSINSLFPLWDFTIIQIILNISYKVAIINLKYNCLISEHSYFSVKYRETLVPLRSCKKNHTSNKLIWALPS